MRFQHLGYDSGFNHLGDSRKFDGVYSNFNNSVILFSKPGDFRYADSINFNDPDDFSDSL